MFAAPWVCSRCLHRVAKASAGPLRIAARHNSNIHGLSEALLSRARSVGVEHATLAQALANEFDPKIAKRVGELSSTANAIKEYEKAQSSLKELRALLESPDQELKELAEEDIGPSQDRIERSAAALKASLVPVHPFAHLPCLVEIRPGAGGDEAGIFAQDLLGMYQGYCSRNKLRTSLLVNDSGVSSSGSNTSLQEAVLEVESPGAYGALRCEAGVHRVQRVPATESKGRVHTSAASVLVLPSLPEDNSGMSESDFNDPKSDYYVDPKDVRTDVMRASGAGGQHVNKTESAVRLTHEPTGIVVMVQETRSQMQNRERAWRMLRSRIAQQRKEQRDEEIVKLRRGAGAGKVGRENKVRTYNYNQTRVTDHRSGFESRALDDVMDGGEALEQVMESVRVWIAEEEVLGLVAEEESKQSRKS